MRDREEIHRACRNASLSLISLLLCAVFALPLAAADRWEVGLSRTGAVIAAEVVAGASAQSPTVLVVGGLGGNDESSMIVAGQVRTFEAMPQARRPFRLIAISVSNPDASKLVFPPTGVAYRENAESHALWRWIAVQAPDLVLVAADNDFGMADALSQNAVAGVGRIPARRVAAKAGILAAVTGTIAPSPARLEIERRRARTPRQVADEYSQVYGHDFDQPTYIPGMALISQIRLGHTTDVARLAAPYLDGSKSSLPNNPSSLNIASHLVFAELSQRTGDARALQLVRRAADLGFTADGMMKESMPAHDEMSDSIFMATTVLAKAGKLTGETRYFDMAARHFAFMEKLVRRPDSLYRHSPLTDAAWGRGNAFAAMGLSLTLSDFPRNHPEFNRMQSSFRAHITALVKYQDHDGMWHEVIDHPGAYAETSATSMIATAILRGIHAGILDAATYQPVVDKAWRGVLAHAGSDGVLIDICESTNKQRTLDDYVHRAAILDRDPRGGGMLMFFATEMAGLQ